MPPGRITGLVSTMNRVREQLSAGIPVSQVDDFRRGVLKTISQVERLCMENNIRPDQLPAPSFSAFQYLKNLDLEHLSVSNDEKEMHVGALRINNLIKVCDWVHEQASQLAAPGNQTTLFLMPDDPRILTVREQIEKNVDSVDEIARRSDNHPARLPKPSRQAYEWLKFLSDANNLCDHLETLRALMKMVVDFEGALTSNAERPMISFRLYNLDTLWRGQKKADKRRFVTVNEGFVGAPAPILNALAQLAVDPKSEAARALVREYAESEDFAEVLSSVTLLAADLDANTRGRHHDLSEVFQRVNATYFGNRVEAPRLVWNRTLTSRKMGHYQPSSDIIMLSISLDDAQVPSMVVDLVMYHELLHKVLGARMVNGQRRVHTPEFRAAERRFRDYTQVNDFLNQWAKRFSLTAFGDATFS